MHYIAAQTLIGGKIIWQYMGQFGHDKAEPGIQITFSFSDYVSDYDVQRYISKDLKSNEVDWIYRDASSWKIDCSKIKEEIPDLEEYHWLKGTLVPAISIERRREKIFDRERDKTYCKFILNPEIVEGQMPKRLFLSHKGIDKPLVRRFKQALEAIGTQPWLDEEAMRAGSELDRAILQGFEESCAAIFFITPDFKDEKFLATEINYAIAQKREKGARFSIITLVFTDLTGATGNVPKLLTPYVYKNVVNELEAFNEIVYALPIRIGELGWR